MVEAPVLGQTLSQLRIHGAYALYRGAIAEALADYARAQGGSMTTDELASYRPVRTAPLRISINGGVALLPTEKVGAGQFARALFAKLIDAQGQIIDSDHTGAGVASATKTTLDSYKIASLPRDFGATGFAAVDASGAAVSCAVGMNGPFGSGRTAGNTGVVLAAAPKSGETELASAFLMPAIETSDGALSLAGSGIGGPNGTAMIALALLDLARGNDLTQPGALHATGFEPFETVNVIQCRDGICATVADPRTFGLGAAAQ